MTPRRPEASANESVRGAVGRNPQQLCAERRATRGVDALRIRPDRR
ncbi:MAG: hypothetical protein WKH64_10680 [Chloroflexia bacterium]